MSVMIYLVSILTMFMMVAFISMNLVVGCESWSQSKCVTPAEFIQLLPITLK